MHKAALKFANQCRARFRIDGPEKNLSGYSLFHHTDDVEGAPMRHVICNGVIGVVYSDPFKDLPKAPDNKTDWQRMTRAQYGAMRDIGFKTGKLPDLKAVKRMWIDEKQRCVGNPYLREERFILVDAPSGECRGPHNTVVVDVEKLIALMELCDCKGGETFWYKNGLSGVYIERYADYKEVAGFCVEGCIMPLRVSDYDGCLNAARKAA